MTCNETAPESQSTGLPITITQCVGSGPAGASTVTCTATISNNFLKSTSAPTTIPATTPTTPPGPAPAGVTSPTRPASTIGGATTPTVGPGGGTTTTVSITPGTVLGGLGGGG